MILSFRRIGNSAMNPHPVNKWIARLPRAVRPRVRLFCFPYAGGGTAVYRRWTDLLPPEIEICLVQLPGREQRIHERPMTDTVDIAVLIADAMAYYCDQPFVLFGHSMGAGIAYETALALIRKDRVPLCVMPSARRAPHLPSPNRARHLLPDDQFVDELKRLDGTPSGVLDSPELMELMLPILRADFQLADLYVSERPFKLPCPVIAFGGEDDVYVPCTELEAWREVSALEFNLRMLPGDHFFVNSQQRELTRLVAQEISRLQR
jgi:surfactin synthase thioesterase subunit